MTVADSLSKDVAVAPDLLRAHLQKREIPSLSGLRGLAAMAVVVWHYLDEWHLSYLYPGPFAVTLFFELSGLLITWLILTEIENTGRLNLQQFYLRRSLRLFPVFYVVWTLCRLAGPFAGSWAYLFYLGDYYTALTQPYSIMTQAWSLGVEEKFYLIWPLLLITVRREFLVKALVVVLVIEPMYRFVLSALGHPAYTWFAFDCRLDSIVVGCLIALLVKRGWRAPQWLGHPATPLAAFVLVFVFQQVSDLVTYLLAILLVSVMCRPSRLLNNVLVRFLGSIPYSLYLIHPYARALWWPRLVPALHVHSIPAIVAGQVALALAGAILLHFMVERPFLLLKDYFSRRPKTLPAKMGV